MTGRNVMKIIERLPKILITFVLILLVCCLVSAVVLVVNGARPDIFAKSVKDESEGHPSMLTETYDYGVAYLNNIVFIGDGVLYSAQKSEIWSENWVMWSGPDGTLPLDYNASTMTVISSVNGDKKTVSGIAENYKPQYILIAIGIENGVEHCSEEKFKEYYVKLIESVKETAPETKIILQSVLPVSKTVSRKTPAIANDKIDRANEWIEEIAEMTSTKYLNSASALKDKKGNLDARYDSGDGIHLNDKGIETLLNYICTHGYQ